MTDIGLDQLEDRDSAVSRHPQQVASRGRAYGFCGHQTDLSACAAAIRKGSKSFHLASMILPRETRQAAQALYAFCRHADDLIDDARASRQALDQLRERLDLIYRGTPAAYACDRAFARTVETYAIPKAVPLALLEGFAMDIANRRYRSIDEVKGYATCVASTVGLMMSLAMRTGDRHALARAADLGIAMQLTNIARDVGEDARNGRLYLPTDWLKAAGVDADDFMNAPRFSPALGNVVERLLEEAALHYRLGHAGIAALPQGCRPAIRTAALVYEEIGAGIAANGYDSVSRRAHTSLTEKLALMVRARLPSPGKTALTGAPLTAAPDPATAALVSAAAAAFPFGSMANRPERADPGRFLTIMMRLQTETREHRRFHRLAAREKAAGLV
jgi:phytoene synthase